MKFGVDLPETLVQHILFNDDKHSCGRNLDLHESPRSCFIKYQNLHVLWVHFYPENPGKNVPKTGKVLNISFYIFELCRYAAFFQAQEVTNLSINILN